MAAPPKPTTWPGIKNAPVVGLAEGNGAFNNYHYAALCVVVPYFVKSLTPFVSRGGSKTYLFLVVLLFLPITVGYWAFISNYGGRVNQRVQLPGKDIEEYITIKDPELKAKYHGKEKIPMQIMHDAYFEGKIDLNGDVLEILEQRHDWAKFSFTPELFKFFFVNFLPDVILHTRQQDETQVREHYDRGDDFYEWFLGNRMIYTSGIVLDASKEETLEEIQDNKLEVICNKLDLQPGDRLLDIGCGWGTLVAYAAKNFGADATGVTLAKNQTAFGNNRIKQNGVSEDQARILCCDYRDIPTEKKFNKIVSLEMGEHVGFLRYPKFLQQIYDLLDDDGIFVMQISGFRVQWQFEDLIWGMFMNKYVFPGADACRNLGWHINCAEGVGFEVKNVDVLGVHYSATLWRWYKNWLNNKDLVVAKYGEKWFRTWAFFLAWSTIISRQGSCSIFQIIFHKNLNAYQRIDGLANHVSIKYPRTKDLVSIN